jgi:hypothetical protein
MADDGWDFEEVGWQDVPTVGALIQLMTDHSAPMDMRSRERMHRLVAKMLGNKD